LGSSGSKKSASRIRIGYAFFAGFPYPARENAAAAAEWDAAPAPDRPMGRRMAFLSEMVP